MAKKKEWIGWVGFTEEKPFTTFDQNGSPMMEVYNKKKDAGYGYPDIRKVKIVEV